MIPLPSIDLLSLQPNLRLKKDKDGKAQVFDPIRKRNIFVTPEEIVRQLWISYLIGERKWNPKLIAVERRFTLNGLEKRFDLVIYDKSIQPLLLAEFKAPGIKITQTVFDQIAQYNMQLHVPFALVSNGVQHFCFQINDGEKKFIWQNELPAM